MDPIWTERITGPKAWRGAELSGDPSWVETFSPDEIADLEHALAAAKATGRPLIDVERTDFPLTVARPRLERVLAEIYDGRGFVVLRGLPVSRYADDDVGLILWGLGRYLGSPLYQNPQGELLGHVYDHGRTYGNIDVRGYETNAYLPYHTDGCDLVGLLCLRAGLEGGLSSIVSSVTVHNEILARHPEYLGLLYNGFYYIRRYIRNQINAGAVKRGVPLTAIELAALDYLDETTRRADLRLDMDLRPGDIQLCNNYTILHSRTDFVDGPEPNQKRHMLRLWLKFPTPWPLAADFPDQVGYKYAPDTKTLIEA
jgi:hypothetical protein